jgi:SAM-dependent methyltransferase
MVLATRRLMDSVRRARQSRPAPVQAVAPTEVFDSANAAALAGADRTHWWFRSKAAYVATAIRRTAAGAADPGWLVDVGAGAGGVTAMLGWRSDRVVVVEGNAALTAQAREAHGLAAVQGAVGRVPLVAGRADVVCLLDVIEHVSDPVGALREAARLLAPDGRVVVNVPAHPWLWSAADEELGHLRRYTRRLLATELRQAGLEPVLVSHVFGWLVPPVWMRRRVSGRGQAELGLDVQSAPIDRAAMVLTAVERIAVGRVSSPVGTSVLAVATRR